MIENKKKDNMPRKGNFKPAKASRNAGSGRNEAFRHVGKSDRSVNQEKTVKADRKAGRVQTVKGNQPPKAAVMRTEAKTAVNAAETSRRAKAPCPIYKKCGSCAYLSLTYPQQLKKKQKQAEALLSQYGKVNPILGMEDPYHYRNKVHAVYDRDRKGNIICGTYEAGTHKVVSVENCLIEDQKSQEIIRTIRDLLKSFKIKTYDEDTGYGLLRHVLIRRGFHSGEIMVILVLGSPILPSKNNFVKALRKAHPEITSVILNVNDKKTSMVLGDREIPLYGPSYITDTLCDIRFRISAKSFYQINPVQTEALYQIAIKYADLKGKERVLDAYCGIGTITLVAARHAGEVIGVELNPDAVRDARRNARENEITNVTFYQGDAGEFLMNMAENEEHLDTVFMDPPRSGSSREFLESVVRCAPKKIVYISCNPETLARDLSLLTKKGYRVKQIQPVDMFPWTDNIETVCLLSNTQKKKDSYITLDVEMDEYYRIKNEGKTAGQ
jgi:23S rRNA (uracil1939-C5)-methyltransferase